MTEGPYKLPKGWRWVRLGEVCASVWGYTIRFAGACRTIAPQQVCPGAWQLPNCISANPRSLLPKSRSFSWTNTKYTSFSSASGPQNTSITLVRRFSSLISRSSWLVV